MSNWERVRLRIETKQELNEEKPMKMGENRTISTHILDTSKGTPAINVPITVFRLENDAWIRISQSKTDEDGRVSQLLSSDQFQSDGIFKLSFDVRVYFNANKIKSFYPLIEVIVECEHEHHYHVPLLLNPFGYSTYRGT